MKVVTTGFRSVRLRFPVRLWNVRFGVQFVKLMDLGRLQLKFGSAIFTFRSIEQMKRFLDTWCVMRAGKIFLHHGFQFHFFTELSEVSLKNLPKDLKVPQFSRNMISKGGGSKRKNNEELFDDLNSNI